MDRAIDMRELVSELSRRPRGRACVVLTHDYFDQKSWAAELARQTGMAHIDLLDLFSENEEMGAKVSSFSIQDLFDFLQEQDEFSVLIVSGIEFLKATWSAHSGSVEEFASRVESWEKSPALLFAMQFNSELAERKFTARYRQYKFVVDQKDTLALI